MKTTLTALMFLPFLLLSCRQGNSSEVQGAAMLQYSPAVGEVGTIVLESRPFAVQVISNGRLRPASSCDLSFPSGGTIVRVNYANGDRVKAGAVIAEIENNSQRLALNAAELSLRLAELEYLDVLAGFGYSDEAAAPENVRDIALVRSGLGSARNDREKALVEYEATCLKAPISGVVANIKKKAWDRSDGDPFCTVIDDSSFDVTFSILESEYPLVSKGQSIKAVPFGQDASTALSGKVLTVNPNIDENGQIEVCAGLAGSSRLINGMNVKVTVDKELDSRLVVPKSAVVVRDNLDVLFLYENGRARWVYVNILAANSDSYAVEANADRGAVLSAGDTVIVSGNLNLADGSPVRLAQQQ